MTWFSDQHHNSLEACYKGNILGHTPDLLKQNLQFIETPIGSPRIWVFEKHCFIDLGKSFT